MKCDFCEEKATVFYTQIANGKLKKSALCESCAQDKGVTNPDGLMMAEQVLDHSLFVPEAEVISLESASECASCGFGISDYRKVGRLGCPDCYDAFKKEIEARIPSLHKGGTHLGYSPAGLMEKQAKKEKLVSLNELLTKAVDLENYEEAARLRDELEKLNSNEPREAQADS